MRVGHRSVPVRRGASSGIVDGFPWLIRTDTCARQALLGVGLKQARACHYRDERSSSVAFCGRPTLAISRPLKGCGGLTWSAVVTLPTKTS